MRGTAILLTLVACAAQTHTKELAVKQNVESAALAAPEQEQLIASKSSTEAESAASMGKLKRIDSMHFKNLINRVSSWRNFSELGKGNKGYLDEAYDIMKLGTPMFFTGVSWVAMAATDTALLGHVSTQSLTASAESSLWTSSIAVIIYGGVLRTFCSQAFGAKNYDLVGIWTQVSLVCLAPLMVLVAVGQMFTGPVLQAFHAPADIIPKSSYYAMVMTIALPARLLSYHIGPFLTSQKIMRPGAVCAAIAMIVNLVAGMILVLGIPIPNWKGFGFAACPAVTVGASWLQFLLTWGIFCQHQKLHKKCWPGWSFSHITANRVKQFLLMYVPAAMSSASDFWRVSVIGIIAASMGKDQIAVFNSSFRILWMFTTFIIGLASAVGIKVGIALGNNQPESARHTVSVGSTMVTSLLSVLGLVFYAIPRMLARIFSSDPRILDLFAQVRLPLATMMVGMNLAVFLEAIPRSLGRTKLVLKMSLLGSWIGQVPSVLLCTRLWRNDLVGVYTGTSVGYALVCIVYAFIIGRFDWKNEAVLAMKRSESLKKLP